MNEQINYRDLAYETANRGGDVGAMIDVAVQAQQALDAMTKRAEAAEAQVKEYAAELQKVHEGWSEKQSAWVQATKRAMEAEAVLKDLRTVMEYADIEFAGWGIPGQEEAYNRLSEWLYPSQRAVQP